MPTIQISKSLALSHLPNLQSTQAMEEDTNANNTVATIRASS
jgi:hypothetical protein